MNNNTENFCSQEVFLELFWKSNRSS